MRSQPEQQVVVVVHEHIMQEGRPIVLERFGEDREELAFVPGILVDVGAVVPPLDDMVDRVRHVIPSPSRHGLTGLPPDAISRQTGTPPCRKLPVRQGSP